MVGSLFTNKHLLRNSFRKQIHILQNFTTACIKNNTQTKTTSHWFELTQQKTRNEKQNYEK